MWLRPKKAKQRQASARLKPMPTAGKLCRPRWPRTLASRPTTWPVTPAKAVYCPPNHFNTHGPTCKRWRPKQLWLVRWMNSGKTFPRSCLGLTARSARGSSSTVCLPQIFWREAKPPCNLLMWSVHAASCQTASYSATKCALQDGLRSAGLKANIRPLAMPGSSKILLCS